MRIRQCDRTWWWHEKSLQQIPTPAARFLFLWLAYAISGPLGLDLGLNGLIISEQFWHHHLFTAVVHPREHYRTLHGCVDVERGGGTVRCPVYLQKRDTISRWQQKCDGH